MYLTKLSNCNLVLNYKLSNYLMSPILSMAPMYIAHINQQNKDLNILSKMIVFSRKLHFLKDVIFDC